MLREGRVGFTGTHRRVERQRSSGYARVRSGLAYAGGAFGSRRFAPAEEAELAAAFGARWDAYSGSVKIPWL